MPNDASRATADPAEAIRIDGLVKVYAGGRDPRGPGRGVRAVDGLSLTVWSGEIFGLLGPNGAGKTTTVGVCTTRVLPTAGRVEVLGADVVLDPVRVKRRIGVVTQGVTLDRSLSVWENLYLHCRYFGLGAADSRARADALLDEFRLADHKALMPEHLSGGMAQRLQLARAVAHRPRLLFLDEPTAGLDPQSRLVLWELIGSLKRAGITVLLTTHYMEEADRLCERIAILDRGRVVACETPAELKRRHAGDAASPTLETVFLRLTGRDLRE